MSAATPTSVLTPAAFHVLLALSAGHAHGYAVMTFIDELTAGAARLGPGTLYRTIARLCHDGLVVETEGSDPGAPHDARRRYYALTVDGERAAASEAAVLARVVAAAAEAGLLPAEDGLRAAQPGRTPRSRLGPA